MDGVDWAETEVMTPYGGAAVRWNREADGIRLEVVVPQGTRAQVDLFDLDIRVGAGTHLFHATYPATASALLR